MKNKVFYYNSQFSYKNQTSNNKNEIDKWEKKNKTSTVYSINTHLETTLKLYLDNKYFIHINDLELYYLNLSKYIKQKDILGVILYGACTETKFNIKICTCVGDMNESIVLTSKLICRKLLDLYLLEN